MNAVHDLYGAVLRPRLEAIATAAGKYDEVRRGNFRLLQAREKRLFKPWLFYNSGFAATESNRHLHRGRITSRKR